METGREEDKEREITDGFSQSLTHSRNKDQPNENKQSQFFRLGRARKSVSNTCILGETQ